MSKKSGRRKGKNRSVWLLFAKKMKFIGQHSKATRQGETDSRKTKFQNLHAYRLKLHATLEAALTSIRISTQPQANSVVGVIGTGLCTNQMLFSLSKFLLKRFFSGCIGNSEISLTENWDVNWVVRLFASFITVPLYVHICWLFAMRLRDRQNIIVAQSK